MASQLTKRGYKYRVLPTNDSDTFNDFLNDDSEFNIKKLDTDLEKLDDKVLLEGKRQQKFDFIKDKVVQDGLVYLKDAKITETTFTTKILDTSGDFTVLLELGTPSNGSTPSSFLYQGTGVQGGYVVNISSSFTLRLGVSDGSQFVYTGSNKVDKEPMKLVLSRNNNIIRLFSLDGKHNIEADCPTMNNKSNYTTISASYAPIDYIAIYERTLTSKEIKHNFSVLDNSSSIKELHTTDSAGKTSILKLGSNSHHTEMSSGRTLEEEYTSLLGRFGKEFDSPDGSAIQVDNSINGKVLNMSINGQTVRCLASKPTPTNLNRSGTREVWFAGKVDLSPIHEYKVTINATLVVGTCNISILNREGNSIFSNAFTIKDGENTFIASSLNINTEISHAFLSGSSSSDASCTVNYINIVDGIDKNKISGNIPFGLLSTQAIIENNGQQYPIYEPTIQGKTRILKAPKDTQNWVEISDDETRDTSKFDYKLDSIAGDLGGTPSISDYIDRARNVKVVNTKEITLNGSENWVVQPDYTTTTNLTCCFVTDVVKTTTNTILSSDFKTIDTTQLKTTEGVMNGGGWNGAIWLSLSKSKLPTQDTQGFKQYLKTNPFTVRYQLATPIEIPLIEKQLSAYNAYKKVISLPFAEDKLLLNEDGSATWIDASNRKTLNDNEPWIKSSVQNAEANCFQIEIIDADNNGNSVIVFCDKLESVTGASTLSAATLKPNTCGIDGSRYLRVGVPKTVDTVEQMKEFAQNLNIIYRSKIQEITHIDKSIVPTILTHKTNILEVGGAVKPSSFKVTVPTTDGIKKEYDLTPINGWKGTAKANLLQTGDIELVLDLTIPSSFNASICSLAVELRPKAERTVLGYNGNTPVVVKIGTDGTVKLPVTATGTVKLDDTYKL